MVAQRPERRQGLAPHARGKAPQHVRGRRPREDRDIDPVGLRLELHAVGPMGRDVEARRAEGLEHDSTRAVDGLPGQQREEERDREIAGVARVALRIAVAHAHVLAALVEPSVPLAEAEEALGRPRLVADARPAAISEAELVEHGDHAARPLEHPDRERRRLDLDPRLAARPLVGDRDAAPVAPAQLCANGAPGFAADGRLGSGRQLGSGPRAQAHGAVLGDCHQRRRSFEIEGQGTRVGGPPATQRRHRVAICFHGFQSTIRCQGSLELAAFVPAAAVFQRPVVIWTPYRPYRTRGAFSATSFASRGRRCAT